MTPDPTHDRGPRTIFCVDLDAFFVSVERRRDPALRDRPVIVGFAGGGRGVVLAASYEVRKFGVRSAMPMVEAERRLRSVADLAIVPPSRGAYEAASVEVRAVLERELPVVEAASIDEFYGDATGLMDRTDALALGGAVAAAIGRECGLPASVGIATSRLVAKIATDDAKPRGVLRILPGREAAFLQGLPIDRIPGVGPKTAPRLHAIGVREVGDVGRVGEASIAAVMGPGQAAWLVAAAAGIDPSPVGERADARSIGHEETFDRDVVSADELEAVVADLAERVAFRLRAEDLAARTVQVKLRYGARRRGFPGGALARDLYETITRAATGPATADGREVAARARALVRAHWRPGDPVRLLGVSASHLVPAASAGAGRQATLFDEPAPEARERERKLSASLDALRGRYGFDAIAWASSRRPKDV